MTLKDWKKTTFGWKKERLGLLKDKTIEISYHKNNFTTYKGKTIKAPVYSVTIFDEKVKTKLFKNKSKALAYAKAYMKKH